MATENTRIRLGRAASTLTAVLSTVLLASTAVSWIFSPQEYSASESKSKLTAIGRALQAYRQEYGVKEPSEWRTFSDAGLPPIMTVLAEPGHAWSLPGGKTTLKISGRRFPAAGEALDFLHLYVSDIKSVKGTWLEQVPEFLKLRGEDFPVLSDPHMTMDPAFRDPLHQPTLVLRLDGRVEQVFFNNNDRLDIYRR